MCIQQFDPLPTLKQKNREFNPSFKESKNLPRDSQPSKTETPPWQKELESVSSFKRRQGANTRTYKTFQNSYRVPGPVLSTVKATTVIRKEFPTFQHYQKQQCSYPSRSSSGHPQTASLCLHLGTTLHIRLAFETTRQMLLLLLNILMARLMCSWILKIIRIMPQTYGFPHWRHWAKGLEKLSYVDMVFIHVV